MIPRLAALVALVATVLLGLISRLFPIGWPPFDKSLGDVLYAVMVFLFLSIAWPRAPLRARAAWSLGICLALETFQLTGIPARAHAIFPPVRFVLGTTFAWHDVGCYVVGVLLVYAIARALPSLCKGGRT